MSEVQVLWRDETAAVICKPSGMLAHNSSFAGPRERAALQSARDALGAKVWLVQRLDRGTSGLMLVTLDGAHVQDWREAIAAGVKQYLAIARGRLQTPAVVDAPLRDDRGVTRDAVSHVEPLAQSQVERVCLVRCTLETGRIHQARRHLNRLSHPVVNDANHGDTRFNRAFRERWGSKRLMLHAHHLALQHPYTKEQICWQAPLSAEMASLIEELFGEETSATLPSEPTTSTS